MVQSLAAVSPSGRGANWVLFDEAGFAKKTNENAADFSDVEAALAALHAPQDDPAAWRSALEDTFDVDVFLRWLAVNTLMVNWDSYGSIAHNYYLYGDPSEGGQLHFISWDHNMSFGMAGSNMGGMMGMGRQGGRGGRGAFEIPEADLPRVPRSRPAPEHASAAAELLKVLLKMVAERNGVAARIIASTDDLERIAADDNADVPALKGWRRLLFGEQALALKQGELALSMSRKGVRAVDLAKPDRVAAKQTAE